MRYGTSSGYGLTSFLVMLAPACYHGSPGAEEGAASAATAEDAGGTAGADGTAGAEGGSDGSSGGDAADEEADFASSAMHRLTRTEYNNTVRDLLGDTSQPANAFPEDGRAGPFAANALAPASTSELELYMTAAETIAAAAVSELGSLVPCTLGEDAPEVCAEGFVRTFGRRAFRRALTDDEVAGYMDLFALGQQQQGLALGYELVLRAMLQSPNFLYRAEVGKPVPERDDIVALTGYEMASRLSYFLWKSTPDDALLDAAETGELDTAAGVLAQAERMLETPEGRVKAAASVAEFHRSWLELRELLETVKDAEVFPEYDEQLAREMLLETDAFVSHVVLEGDASLESLLTAAYTFATPAIAELYGATHPGGDMAQIELDPAQRSGLLTQASVMARHSHTNQTSPVLRGYLVRSQLLCQTPPPPPPDVDDEPPAVDPNLPTKERYAAHSDVPSCAGCHTLMDPLGFGFENYDAIGKWRTLDGNNPVDATGEVIGTLDIDGPFEGARELGTLLASSEQVRACLVRQWFRFSQGRVDEAADQTTIAHLVERFIETDGDIRDLMIAFTTTDAFRHRKLPLQ